MGTFALAACARVPASPEGPLAPITLEKAFAQEKELQLRYDEDEEAAELLDMAKLREGLSRNVGKHAGGVVIAPSRLTDFTALYSESAETQAVTQLDKDDLESIGLVKFDFLGLRTLTVIDWAIALGNKLKRNLFIYAGADHPHAAQQPTKIA